MVLWGRSCRNLFQSYWSAVCPSFWPTDKMLMMIIDKKVQLISFHSINDTWVVWHI
jgi:hypothetical protein